MKRHVVGILGGSLLLLAPMPLIFADPGADASKIKYECRSAHVLWVIEQSDYRDGRFMAQMKAAGFETDITKCRDYAPEVLTMQQSVRGKIKTTKMTYPDHETCLDMMAHGVASITLYPVPHSKLTDIWCDRGAAGMPDDAVEGDEHDDGEAEPTGQ